MRKLFFLILLLIPVLASAQVPTKQVRYRTGAPTGTCTEIIIVDRVTGASYNCVAGTWTVIAGGSGSPGGSTTQVQYNNAGSFGGISGATTDGTTLTLVAPVLGDATATSLTTANASITGGTISATTIRFPTSSSLPGSSGGTGEVVSKTGTNGSLYHGDGSSGWIQIRDASIDTANYLSSPSYCADAGANDTYTCSLSPAITSYVTGTKYVFTPNTSNTGAATLNLNSLGAKTLVKVAGGITTALADNDLRAGSVVVAYYDGTNMEVVSGLGNAGGGGAGLTANTFTATQTINPAANTSALVTSGSLTGSDTTPFLNIAGTWNTSGAPSAIKLNVTNTASDAESVLLDLQVASVRKFSVRKDGAVFTGPISTGAIVSSSSIDASGSLTLAGDGHVAFASRSVFESPASGEIRVTNNTFTSPASIYGLSRKVEAKTANYSVAVLDSNKFFTNTGAGGTVNFTLPTAAAGLQYTFYIDAAQTFTITAGASTTIRIVGTASAAAGNITANTVGNAITLTAISTTQWISASHEGTWTIN